MRVHSFWRGIAFNLAIVFSLIFVFQHTQWADAADQSVSVHAQTSNLVHFKLNDHDSGNYPFRAHQLPPERELPGRDEVEEDSFDELNYLTGDFIAGISLDAQAENWRLHQLRQASNCRAKISLVILHHSWKSFLA